MSLPTNIQTENYVNIILLKCIQQMPVIEKIPQKIDNDKLKIPSINNYNDFLKINYNISQLKIFAKHYKLKLYGNKHDLFIRIYSYLYFSYFIIKIQRTYRGRLVKRYKTLRGPAIITRSVCNNSTDFVTMEPVRDISFHQFFSYKDEDGFIYGFDITSLHNLLLSKSKDVNINCINGINGIQNPYNRNYIPNIVVNDLRSVLKISKIINANINLNFEDDTQNLSTEKSIELKALSLFQAINALGNYSDPKWFLSLNRHQIVKLIRELNDIWNYRAQLSYEVKCKICSPNGDPFRNFSMSVIYIENDILLIKKMVLDILGKFVNNGIDNDSKALGSYYVLGALTLVNSDAAEALPWLYQSLNYY